MIGTDTDEDTFCLCDVCYRTLIRYRIGCIIIHLQRLPLTSKANRIRRLLAQLPDQVLITIQKNGFFL